MKTMKRLSCGKVALCHVCVTVTVLIIVFSYQASSAPALVIRNNHNFNYHGPLDFKAGIPGGYYQGKQAHATVHKGVVTSVVNLPANGQVTLSKFTAAASTTVSGLTVQWEKGKFIVKRKGKQLTTISLGFVVIPGRTATACNVPAALQSIGLSPKRLVGGVLASSIHTNGYKIDVSLRPIGDQWVDVEAFITRVSDSSDPVYLAFVRMIDTLSAQTPLVRWNGRVMNVASDPNIYDKAFVYSRGLDWIQWKSGANTFLISNQFSPGYAVQREKDPNRWLGANHFYTYERFLQSEKNLYLISEIAGPNAEQEKSVNLAGKTYRPPSKDMPVRLKWRLAITKTIDKNWQTSQFLGLNGYLRVSNLSGQCRVDLGVPNVQFGTSYFPYSTITENFDYYRTKGLDREGWWPFSAQMWIQWEKFAPQIQTDLRIIRSMGFDWVRLHHLELLGGMDDISCFSFLDFYMKECRNLGLKVLVDTAGSTEWVWSIAERYRDVVKMMELENEVLIPGIRPGDPERWKDMYKAAKTASPDLRVFLTGVSNVGIFDRLLKIGVPFDCVGMHCYKHGPDWPEAFASGSAATGTYASRIDKDTVLGEFNWKYLTALSPEKRTDDFIRIFSNMLEPRAIPYFFQFHFQETMSVNPRITRQGIRHYETIGLDRRPKPEGRALMGLIRKYTSPDSPVCSLPITIDEVTLAAGHASADFHIRNAGKRPVILNILTESFGGLSCRLLSPKKIYLKPGEVAKGEVELRTEEGALPGTYHFFVRAQDKTFNAIGWGIASNPGSPSFDTASILNELVDYPQRPAIVDEVDWSRPFYVAFGRGAPVIEVEMAYQVWSTLQSATGRPVRLSDTMDIPKQMLPKVSLVLIGTSKTNPLIASAGVAVAGNKGAVILHKPSKDGQWLLLTGADSAGVQACATDFVLRFWKNAKDSTTRVTGLEKGAALGSRVKLGELNPP